MIDDLAAEDFAEATEDILVTPEAIHALDKAAEDRDDLLSVGGLSASVNVVGSNVVIVIPFLTEGIALRTLDRFRGKALRGA